MFWQPGYLMPFLDYVSLLYILSICGKHFVLHFHYFKGGEMEADWRDIHIYRQTHTKTHNPSIYWLALPGALSNCIRASQEPRSQDGSPTLMRISRKLELRVELRLKLDVPIWNVFFPIRILTADDLMFSFNILKFKKI